MLLASDKVSPEEYGRRTRHPISPSSRTRDGFHLLSLRGTDVCNPAGVGVRGVGVSGTSDRIRPGLLCRNLTIFGPSRAVTATTDIHDDTSDHHAAVRDGAGICDRWVTALDGTDCDGCVGEAEGGGPGKDPKSHGMA